MKQELLDPRLFVRLWAFKLRKLKIKPNRSFEGENADTFNSLWLDYEALFNAELAKGASFDAKTGKRKHYTRIPLKNMEMAWSEFLTLAAEEARESIVNTLKFDAAIGDEEIKRFVNAVVDAPKEFDTAIFKHFIWQVKRKLNNKSTVYHLAPILWGPQGGGKTGAIEKLLEPIKAITVEWGISEAIDPRNIKALSENYVCFFDEMAGAQRVEIENLKRTISAQTTTYRPLGTNRHVTVRQNCTFIGVSNKSLTENIYDPTGLRRFAEITCKKRLDWEVINSIDSLKIWRGIDENLERGYLESFASEMRKHQEELLIEDEMQHFVRECGLMFDKAEDAVEIRALDLYNNFLIWRDANGYAAKNPMVFNSFCMKLRSHGFNKRVRKIEGKEKTFYIINKNALLSELLKERMQNVRNEIKYV